MESSAEIEDTIGVQRFRLAETGLNTICVQERTGRKRGGRFGLEGLRVNGDEIDNEIRVDTLSRIELVSKKLDRHI